MSARRVMGIETEYGVSAPGDPAANAMLMSSQVVNAYAAPLGARAGRARWDYEDEAPLRDARGWELSRESADPSQLTDVQDDPGLANVVLTNGARLYVDHAHPEYSSPEVTSPRDAISGDEYSGCAWSTYSRAPLVRITFARPGSSGTSVSWLECALSRLTSQPRASRSGASSS